MMAADISRNTSLSRGVLAWMASHPVTANLLMLVLLAGGLLSAHSIKQEVFPGFTPDLVSISIAYPGASPEEVERGIVLAVQEAIQGLENIEEVRATAGEGLASISVEMIEGGDLQRLAQDVQNAIDRISTFPAEAEDPVVHISSSRQAVVSLALYGPQSEQVLREYGEFIRDTLLADPAISQVDLSGVRAREIAVEIPQDTLRRYHLSLDDVAAAIRHSSVELPGGAIKTSAGDVMIRVTDRRDFSQQFEQLTILSRADGSRVFLGDIAEVKDGFEETDRLATYNDDPALMLEVYRMGEQTPIVVSDAVRDVVARVNQQLPEGLSIALRNDRSEYYRQRLDLMLRNGMLGLVLVFFLLALFLEARLAFWVSLGIPVSFLGTLLVLPAMDISINMISMFAFIVTLGIVVDDAIVVGENIYYERQRGVPWLEAAIQGARDISVPIVFSVLTNMITFLPLYFVPGVMGKIFKQIPVVVVSVFAISLIESLLILPAHLGHSKERSSGGLLSGIHWLQQRFSRGFTRMVQRLYGPLLRLCIEMRYATLMGGILILALVLGYVKSGRMGFDLFPKIESDYALVTATLPFGSAFAETLAVQQRLVEAARELQSEHGGDSLVEGVYARIDGNETQVRIYLTDPDRRPLSTAEVIRLWREKVGAIAGMERILFESDAGGPGRGRALSIELSHRNMASLEAASQELSEELGSFSQVRDIDDGFSAGKRQIDFQITSEARSLGLQSSDIARQLRNAYYGATALRQQRGRDEVAVVVRLPRKERQTAYSLEQMVLRAPGGLEIPLTEAVSQQKGRAYTDISHRNGRRVITVQADVRPRSQAVLVKKELLQSILPRLGKRYPGLSWDFVGRQAAMKDSLDSLKRGMGMALLVIFAMLAIAFNSYIQPVIIMTSIPFGLVGAVIGHLLMGYSLSLTSFFGVVALSGVVVNDSLVLVNQANRCQKGGLDTFRAVHKAAIQRFRPIILTTLTTFGGLSPMIFETSRQARYLIPMAISLGFGILFSTLIILVLVPALYVVVEDLKGLEKRLWRLLFAAAG